MAEKKQGENPAETEAAERETISEPVQRRPIESFYENFRDVPLKYVDIFIGVCVAAFFIVLILGTLKGRGII